MRQGLFWAAAAAALTAGLGPASASPLEPAAPAGAVPVQYWGYERPYAEPYDGRRYVVPDEDEDEDFALIPPRQAIAITRSMGYRAIARPRLAGSAWVVDALGPQGQLTRVSIHARTGAPIAIREMEPGGARFPTPPVWPDERPAFGRAPEGAPPPVREGRPDLQAPRPARPSPNITARAVPVPAPRPPIDETPRPGGPQPQAAPPAASEPPAAAAAPEPPAARLQPRDPEPQAPLSVEPATPFTPPEAPAPQAAPPAPPEPPTAALPPAPAPAQEPPAAAPPSEPPVEAPPAEAQQPAPAPAPPVAEAPPPAAPAAPARDPEPDGIMIDGRFLGPNGEPLPSGPGDSAAPGVRQVPVPGN